MFKGANSTILLSISDASLCIRMAVSVAVTLKKQHHQLGSTGIFLQREQFLNTECDFLAFSCSPSWPPPECCKFCPQSMTFSAILCRIHGNQRTETSVTLHWISKPIFFGKQTKMLMSYINNSSPVLYLTGLLATVISYQFPRTLIYCLF